MKDWVPSTPRRVDVDFEYESLEDIVCHLYELVSLNISVFEGAPRKTLYIDHVMVERTDGIRHTRLRTTVTATEEQTKGYPSTQLHSYVFWNKKTVLAVCTETLFEQRRTTGKREHKKKRAFKLWITSVRVSWLQASVLAALTGCTLSSLSSL